MSKPLFFGEIPGSVVWSIQAFRRIHSIYTCKMGNRQSGAKKEEQGERRPNNASAVTRYSVEVEYVFTPNRERKGSAFDGDTRLMRLAKKHGGEWTASDVGPFSSSSSWSKSQTRGPLTRANNFEFAFRKGSKIGRSRAAASAENFVRGLPEGVYVDFISASDRGMDNHYYVFSRRGLDTKVEVATEEDERLHSVASTS